MTDIYTSIRMDHDNHRELLNRIAHTSGDSAERRAAWDSFYHDVKSHAAAEEETFYSKLISKTWGQDAARHSVHEHQQLDDLMEELREMDMSRGRGSRNSRRSSMSMSITWTRRKTRFSPARRRLSPKASCKATPRRSRSARPRKKG